MVSSTLWVCPTFYTRGSSGMCGPCSLNAAMSREKSFIACYSCMECCRVAADLIPSWFFSRLRSRRLPDAAFDPRRCFPLPLFRSYRSACSQGSSKQGRSLCRGSSSTAWIAWRRGCSVHFAWASRCAGSKRWPSCRSILRQRWTKPASSLASAVLAGFASRASLAGCLRRLQRTCQSCVASARSGAAFFRSRSPCPACGRRAEMV